MPSRHPAFGSGHRAALLNIISVSMIEYPSADLFQTTILNESMGGLGYNKYIGTKLQTPLPFLTGYC